jgi:hypothetical protein
VNSMGNQHQKLYLLSDAPCRMNPSSVVKPRRPNPKDLATKPQRDALFAKESVKRWLRGISPDSHYKVLNVLHRFLLWREKQGLEANPDKLVAEVRKGTNETRIEHLQAAKDWLEGAKELRYASVASRLAYFKAVKSFYRHNLVDLPMGRLNLKESREEEVEVTTEPTATEFLGLTKRVLDSAKLSARDRAVVLVKLQSFCDNKVLCNVFNFVAFPQLVKHFGTEDFRGWDERKAPVKVGLVRPKNHYQYYTFLHRDAIVALKEWLQYREAHFGRIRTEKGGNPRLLPRSDPIFVTRFHEVRALRASYIATLFNRFGQRAGVNERPHDDLPKGKEAKRRYPFHGHEVRDTAVSLARTVRADRDAIEYFCGHKIDALNYDKSPRDNPDYFKREYDKLAPYLNVVSGEKEQLRQGYETKLEERIAQFEEEKKTWESRFEELRAMILSAKAADAKSS